MQRFLIIATNCGWLALLLVGLPAATHAQLLDWQIGSASTGQGLLVWGLSIGSAGNLLAGICVVKGRKGKVLCWEWTAIFAGLLLICWGLAQGYLNFNWLREALFWARNHF